MHDNISKIQVTRNPVPVAQFRTYTNRFRAANDNTVSLWQLLKLTLKRFKHPGSERESNQTVRAEFSAQQKLSKHNGLSHCASILAARTQDERS